MCLNYFPFEQTEVMFSDNYKGSLSVRLRDVNLAEDPVRYILHPSCDYLGVKRVVVVGGPVGYVYPCVPVWAANRPLKCHPEKTKLLSGGTCPWDQRRPKVRIENT